MAKETVSVPARKNAKAKRPTCPVCGNEMIREHWELHDGSGWSHGWTCVHDPITTGPKSIHENVGV